MPMKVTIAPTFCPAACLTRKISAVRWKSSRWTATRIGIISSAAGHRRKKRPLACAGDRLAALSVDPVERDTDDRWLSQRMLIFGTAALQPFDQFANRDDRQRHVD